MNDAPALAESHVGVALGSRTEIARERFGAATQLSTGANSHYSGLQLTAEKRLSNGIQVQGNYTWSRCIVCGDSR